MGVGGGEVGILVSFRSGYGIDEVLYNVSLIVYAGGSEANENPIGNATHQEGLSALELASKTLSVP